MGMSGAVLVGILAPLNSLFANNNLGHCYLMMDDLQQAYSAYQQALYHLRDPKVSHSDGLDGLTAKKFTFRNQNSGTVSGFCTIVMGLLNMPKRPFLKSCGCSLILKKPTRSTFDSA